MGGLNQSSAEIIKVRLKDDRDIIRFFLNLPWEFDQVSGLYHGKTPHDVAFPDGKVLYKESIIRTKKPLPGEIELISFVPENLNASSIDEKVEQLMSTAVIKCSDKNRHILCFRQRFTDTNGVVWDYLGNGSYNTVYRTKLAEPLPVGDVRYPVGADLVFRLHNDRFSTPADTSTDSLCRPTRATRLLNLVETAFHYNSNRLPTSVYLDGLISPFINRSKIEPSELPQNILQLYLKTGRIILDGSVPGNLLKGPHFPDLDFAIRRDSQASISYWGSTSNRTHINAWFFSEESKNRNADSVRMIKALLYLEWHQQIPDRRIAIELANNPKAVYLLNAAYNAVSHDLKGRPVAAGEINLGVILGRAREDIKNHYGRDGVRFVELLDTGAPSELCWQIIEKARQLGSSADMFFTQDQAQLTALLRYMLVQRRDQSAIFESILAELLTLPHQQIKLFLALRNTLVETQYQFKASELLVLAKESMHCDARIVERVLSTRDNCLRLLALCKNGLLPRIAFECVASIKTSANLESTLSLRQKAVIFSQLVYKTENNAILESLIGIMKNLIEKLQENPTEYRVTSEFINQVKIAHRDAMTILKNRTQPNTKNMPSLFSCGLEMKRRLRAALDDSADQKYVQPTAI